MKKTKQLLRWGIRAKRDVSEILLDYFDVVVHVFRKDERDYYELERLWADAPMKEINDEGS